MFQDWLDQLQPASWRGVPVHIDSVRVTGGPQVVVREYPFSDLPTFHTLGLKGERFQLNLYVYGKDYLDQSDRLLEALNQSGPGTLTHPWGSVEVVLESGWEFELRADKLGRVRFTCTFVRAEERRYPRVTINRRAGAAEAIAVSRQASVDSFARQFSIDKQPGWVQQSAKESVEQALQSFTQGVDGFEADSAQALSVLDDASGIQNHLDQLMNRPADLGSELMNLLSRNNNSVNGVSNGFTQPSTLTNFSVQPNLNSGSTYIAGQPTPSRQQQQQNTQAVETLVRSAAVASVSETVINQPDDQPVTRETFNQQEQLLADGYEQLLDRTDDADAYQATTDSYTKTLAVLQTQKPAAAQLDAITPTETLPAKVLSYQLYGSGNNADELVARNGVENPLFVPGGETLEVVRHG